MNSDCVDHLVKVYVDCLRICGERARTYVRICLYGMYTVLYCSVGMFYYGLFIGPTLKMCTISGIIILGSIPITLFFWMAIELLRKLDESIPIYMYVRQRRHYLDQTKILRSLVSQRQQSIQEAVPDSPTLSVSVAPQTAFNVTRLPLRRETPISRYLRDSSLSSPTVPRSRLQRSASGHKKLRDPGEELLDFPGNETRWIMASLFTDDEETYKRIKEQNPSMQFRQLNITDISLTQGALSSRRSSHSTGKKNENPIPQMNVREISPIVGAKGGMRSSHSTGKKNENPIPQMNVRGISPIVGAESRMRSSHSTGKKNKNPIPQMNVRGISPIVGAEGRIRSRHSSDEILDPQMNVSDRPPTPGAVGFPGSRHQTRENVSKLLIRLKGRLRPRYRTK